MELLDRWDETYGDSYLTVGISPTEKVDVKRCNTDDGFMYVMDCSNGKNVYTNDSSEGCRNLNVTEYIEIMDFVREQFKVEEEIDRRVV